MRELHFIDLSQNRDCGLYLVMNIITVLVGIHCLRMLEHYPDFG